MKNFKDANLSRHSREKVIFECPTCSKTYPRRYSSCVGKTTCKYCTSGKDKINHKVIPFEEALKICSKGSHRKVERICPGCSRARITSFKSALKSKLCKSCNNIKTGKIKAEKGIYKGSSNPFYGKTHTKEYKEQNSTNKLLATAKKCGFDSYENLTQDVISYLESTGFGPYSAEAQLKYPNINSETIKNVLKKANRLDLITDNNLSTAEKALVSFIKSHYTGQVIENDRRILEGKELDIYLPELNVAIEYNGLHWHSEKFVEKTYHRDKYLKCLEKGIKLYTIWDYIYLKNPEAVHTFIKGLVVLKPRVFARKCTIIKDSKKLKKYIKTYHLQGLAPSQTYLGLEFEGKIVMAISLGKHHRGNSSHIVLNRVCFSHYNVIGGLNKLLKLCPKNLITWSDNCYSPLGSMYKNAGFVLTDEMPIDYFYTNGGGIYFSKQSQSKKQTNCPPESELVNEGGLFKVWDCGKKRWILP